MNILQVTKYYYPAVGFGGPVQCTCNLSRYPVKRGAEVTICTTDSLDGHGLGITLKNQSDVRLNTSEDGVGHNWV